MASPEAQLSECGSRLHWERVSDSQTGLGFWAEASNANETSVLATFLTELRDTRRKYPLFWTFPFDSGLEV